jgi:ribulose-5-phosphate 4-epimerase/fuculose-1-phosphate aldolase
MLHWVIYRKRKDVNAIFHGHYGKILRYSRELSLPSTLKNEPYGTIELAKRVLDILDDHDFLIMKDHGFISLGKDMDKAGGQVLRIYKKLGQSA